MYHSLCKDFILLAVFYITTFTACNYLDIGSLGKGFAESFGSNDLSVPYPIIGPESPNGYQAILATTDLGLGENRFAFVLLSDHGFVDTKIASLVVNHSKSPVPEHRYEASLLSWKVSRRGTYVRNITFPESGEWEAGIYFEHDGSEHLVELLFSVGEKTAAPAIGDIAPDVSSKTLADVGNIQELSTGIIREPELYRYSLAETIQSGSPTVVSFTSPAFCENEVCGPQVDVLRALHKELSHKIYFVHVEIYDNPDELQGDLHLARFSETFQTWALPSLQWTFIIDCEGKIAGKFEGFATLEELRPPLVKLIKNDGSGQRCWSR